MRIMTKIMGAVGFAAMAAATPATAQYYGYNPYAYSNPYTYSNPYGYSTYAYGMNTSVAANQCSSAVQSRLSSRVSLGSILGSLVGIPTTSYGRVVSVTQVTPRSDGTVRVRGLASSGRSAYNGYGPYGMGAYGALGYSYANAADLSFRCDVYPNGAVYNVRVNRRY
ncbi:MAG: hypothetical protein ACJ8ET_10060 [Sphingomicrobium sp.]